MSDTLSRMMDQMPSPVITAHSPYLRDGITGQPHPHAAERKSLDKLAAALDAAPDLDATLEGMNTLDGGPKPATGPAVYVGNELHNTRVN